MAVALLLLPLLARAGAAPEPPSVLVEPPLPAQPPDALFAAGAEAYSRGDWPAVVLHMERALRARAALRSRSVRCRLRCANVTAGAEPGAEPVLRDLLFFRGLLRRAACLRGCGAPSRYRLGEELQREFAKRSPYNYLQVAYFKVRHRSEVPAPCHGQGHLPRDQGLQAPSNLAFNTSRDGAGFGDEAQWVLPHRKQALEPPFLIPSQKEFRLGVRFYSEEQPAAAILHLEKALEEYFVADAECRALCEGPYDYEGYNYLEYNADLFQAITDHYMQVLSCKQGCVTELASEPSREKPLEDFLPLHFNYLQFAYYNHGNYEKAIECAKTYLLFFPNDEVMKQNLAYYTAVLGENLAGPIQPREEIRAYHQQSLMEKELLFFSYDVFGIPFVDPDSWTPEEVIPKRLREKQKVERETAARISEEIGNLMKEIETLVEEKAKESAEMSKLIREGGPLVYEGASVTMNSKALNGSQRVVVDGVLSAKECQELQSLTNAAASAGDGYRGKTSPHTPSETFYGVTVLKALKLGQEGRVPLQSAYLYYNVTEKVRHMMESYFRLEVPLHFSYSHLVCRTAIEEKQEGRKDNSHEVHVDNCILNAESLVCVKEPPAYTFRDYSAILYLNGDFEGGAFYFTELDAKTETAEVQPQCGRAVGFSSGSENPHGVKAVTKGQRCAIALWFTLDPRHSERVRSLPSSRWVALGGQRPCLTPRLSPQERVQADDLVKMLFGIEEGDLLLEPEQNPPVAAKDEL
ncbi:P3H1 hydroxylase, partial [Centropus unirufus]|nr:P3H1 hydroxylase [Centropus unirufus]